MGRNLFLAVICLLMSGGWLHGQTYHLTVSSAPYQDLTGGTVLVPGPWDDPQFTVPLGFTFHYFDKDITELVMNYVFKYIVLSDREYSDTLAIIGVYGEDMIDRGFELGTGQSPITYKTTGTTGHHVTTIEWQNAGFYSEYYANGHATDYVNFQLKIEEETGDIVMHYGPSSVTDPDLAYEFGGPFVGLFESIKFPEDYSLGEVVLLSGDPENPEIHDDYNFTYLNGTIPANTVYRFSREITAVHEPFAEQKKNYFTPTLSSSYVTLSAQYANEVILPVRIFDATGNLVATSYKPEEIDVKNFLPGIYQFSFQTKDGPVIQRITVIK